jgi:hypothetical protein
MTDHEPEPGTPETTPVRRPTPPTSTAPISTAPISTAPISTAPLSTAPAQTAPTPEVPPTPGRARGAILTGARIVTGLIGVAIAVVTVGAATLLPLPDHSVSRAPIVVSPAATSQQRVCAGALLVLGNASGEGASVVSSIGRPTVRFGQSSGSATSGLLGSTDNTSGVAPQVVTLPASTDGARPLISGAQSQSAATNDVYGLASAECREPDNDTWLVGGATTTGRTTLISLVNPSTVAATVTLTIYSEGGTVNAPGTDGIVVAPGSQKVLSLAAFAPGIASPIVHVESRGGQIVPTLQQSTIRTLEAGGVDIISGSASPAKTQTISGITIADSTATTARQAEDGFSDLGTVVRVFVPGDKPVSAKIAVATEGGTSKPASVKVDLTAGVVNEVPLDSFPDGNYSVTISAAAPLVAAARVSTVGTDGRVDFAWVGAGTLLRDRALFSVASLSGAATSPLVHLTNPTSASQRVVISQRGTTVATVTVPAGKTVSHSLSGSTSAYRLSGFTRLYAALSLTGDGQIAAYGITPSSPEPGAIVIHP